MDCSVAGGMMAGGTGSATAVLTPAVASDPALQSAIHKALWRILPFLALGFFFNFLDRTSVSFAALQMNKSLGLTATQFGWGAGLLFVSYCLFEVPSNMAMYHIGARRWLARIMITWGIAAAATAFASGPLSFYILRFILGAFEAGFFPGVILYLSLWFPPAHRARVVAYFIAAAPVSQFIGAPVSVGLLQLNGAMGLEGWQWMFLLEGLPACVLGLVCLRLLVDRPSEATWLTAPEKAAITAALAQETQDRPSHRLRDAVRDPRVLMLACISLTFTAGSFGVSFWLPLIMKDAGLTNGQISWMSAIPYLIATVISLLWAGFVDRTGLKLSSLLVSLVLGITGLALSVAFTSFLPALICLTVSLIGTIAARSLFFAIPQSYLSGAATAGGLAFINCIGSLGGFVGPYLVGWLKDATGSYNAGMLGMAGIVVISAVLTIVLKTTSTVR
jgi:ACS family tartrate transporter-like MFS transporter